jgi:hypothetical protein
LSPLLLIFLHPAYLAPFLDHLCIGIHVLISRFENPLKFDRRSAIFPNILVGIFFGDKSSFCPFSQDPPGSSIYRRLSPFPTELF